MNETKLPDKYKQMAEAPLFGLITRLAIPGIITNLITTIYNAADTYFVSSLGTSATGAVGISFALMTIIQASGMFAGLCAGKYENAARMAATGFFSAMIMAFVLVTLPGLFFLEQLATLFGATPTILPYACDYMFYISIGAPFMAGALMMNNLLRFQGSAFLGMVGMIAGALLNVILDPIFIFRFNMGIGGAARATILSQIATFCVLLYGCTREGNISIKLSNFTPRLSLFKEMLRGGLPSLCRQSIGGISSIYVNHTAGVFGDAAIAATSIVQRVIMFCAMALIGYGQGFQPICGFNYGAKNYDRVKKAFYLAIKITTVALIIFAGTEFIFARQIIMWFNSYDSDVIDIGTQMLRLQCLTFPLMSCVVLVSMLLQTIGSVVRASIMSLAWQGLFLIPCVFLFVRLFALSGYVFAVPAATILSFLFALPLAMATFRDMSKKAESDKAKLRTEAK